MTEAGAETWAVGTFNDRLAGVTAAGDTIWAVGYYKDNGRKTLIERRRTAGP